MNLKTKKMKTTIVLSAIILSMGFTSCDTNTAKITEIKKEKIAVIPEAKSTEMPIMNFDKKNHDFGTINEGDLVKHTFTFTNTGAAPLVILSAKGSCGCTVPKWTKEPIEPGESGEIQVAFNSKGKPNLQSKKVTITTNTKEGKEVLTIKAMVTPKIPGK